MKPIFFPATFVSDSVAQALTACFGQFIVYQPLTGKIPEQMRNWIERDILNIRVPVTKDQNEIEAVVKSYLSWADLHFGGTGLKPPFLQTWKDAIPFFESSSTSQVVADIKKLLHGKPASRGPEPLFAARLFLYFAQEFDRQNQDVVRDLKRHRQQEAELIRQLKMEDDSLSTQFQKEEVQEPETSAGYLVSDRLGAWIRIFLEDTDISAIFITHIPTVLQELLDYMPTAQKLLSIKSIPICLASTDSLAPWREQLLSDLALAVEDKWSTSPPRLPDQPIIRDAGETVSLRVYLLPDKLPRDFFSDYAHIHSTDRDVSLADGKFNNTLIGLVEFDK
ncbi:MAG: hypothetical protein PVF32_24235 [Desulfobacterales bacterium]|jgi:hypothetical protein